VNLGSRLETILSRKPKRIKTLSINRSITYTAMIVFLIGKYNVIFEKRSTTTMIVSYAVSPRILGGIPLIKSNTISFYRALRVGSTFISP
jgi:hypothetical protein